MTSLEELFEAKAEWRRTLLQRRRTSADTTRAAENEAVRSWLLQWIGEQRITTVAAYVPRSIEPGDLGLLEGLRSCGSRVLLPIVVGEEPLDWAAYTGSDSLRSGAYGILEPTGERLGPATIGEAEAVLVPALAVDHRGIRLGRGGGYYDRSLPKASIHAVLLGVVRDDELLAELPGEAHDVRMNAVLTPSGGVRGLPM